MIVIVIEGTLTSNANDTLREVSGILQTGRLVLCE